MKPFKTYALIIIYLIVSVPVLYIASNLYSNKIALLIIYSLITFLVLGTILHRGLKKFNKFYMNERDMLYNILDDVDAIIIVWSKDLRVFNYNDCFLKKTQYPPDFLKKAKNIKSVFLLDYDNHKDIATILDNRDITIKCSDGSCLSVIWKTTVIQEGKQPVYLSIGIDYTQILDMENKLTESEKKLDIALELSEIGLFLRFLDSDKCFISANLQKLFGFSSQEILMSEFEEIVHPKDVSLVHIYTQNMQDATIDEFNKIVSIDLRIKCLDEGYRWFNYRFRLSESFGLDLPVVGGSLIDISKDKEKDTLIEKMAYIDEVTQIYNRNRFMMLGQETYSCSKELGFSYWLIILDVDKFHIINDTCGYQNGNYLLHDIALTILKNLASGGFCARIGSDNFAILIRNTGDDTYPVTLVKKIQSALFELSTGIFSTQTITASAGYCKLPEDGKEFSQVLEHAEFALRLGELPRSNIVRYDNFAHDKIIQKSTLEKELENAIIKNELVLYYQPKINLITNEVIGCEALIRWIKADGTIIPPNSFIPVAESSNLITRISEFVINEACRQTKLWQESGLPPISISINLSSVDFYQTNILKTIQDALDATGISPELLEVELTESLALKDIDHAIRQMKELNQIGIKVSMDDFGTGYSSLSYIQVLPISLLKLDRSFIMNLETDEVSRQIVSSVINICKSKQIEILAEGIETESQAVILRKSGCNHAQGYYFGRPMPQSEFETYFRNALKITL